MLLEIVGVQLDQARQEIVAVEIGGAGGAAAAFAHLCDLSVADDHRTVEFAVGHDDAGIGENVLGTHAATPGDSTVYRRVASASRTAVSWKMPTIAAPALRRSWIRSITPSRLAVSSEAVGSSSSRTG